MCRFVAYRGPVVDLGRIVFGGAHPLAEQSWAPRELLVGSMNADGYGIAWFHGDRPIRLARREPIWYDPDLEDLLGVLSARTVVAAVRNATPGMSSGGSGLAPLVRSGWCFALNGFVPGFDAGLKRAFHRQLSDAVYPGLRDGSDTEALLLVLLQLMDEGRSPVDAVTELIRWIRELVGALDDPGRWGAQLNMILTDGDRMVVSRASSVEAANSLHLAVGPDLFPGGVVVASEPLDDDPGWKEVAPQTVLDVSGEGTLEVPL